MARLFNKLKKGLDSLMAPAEDPRLTFAQTYDRQNALSHVPTRSIKYQQKQHQHAPPKYWSSSFHGLPETRVYTTCCQS